MKQKHVILKFDYEDATRKVSVSKVSFPEKIHDVKFIEFVDFSPSASLLSFSCDLVGENFFFSNFTKKILFMGLGGNIKESERIVVRVEPSSLPFQK